MIWFPFFTSLGLILAIKFFYPTFLSDAFWLTFGRVRPAHVDGVLFGFLSSGLIAAMFYIVPRLCNSPLYKPKLAMVNAGIWNFGVLAGEILLLLGYTQAREYAEYIWPIDVVIMICLIINGYIILGTIIKRREKKLYVSLWFYAGIAFWFPIVYFVGNVMWNPPTGALTGLVDAVFNWFYGHNVLGLWFTPFGIALWYYFIPRFSKRALYSVTLSFISFFALAFFYTGLGGHHILQSPIPNWLKDEAVIASILMQFSVLAFAANIGMTLRGRWSVMLSSVPFRFMIFGFLAYIFVSIQGSFQALMTMNSYLHFSQWPVGHAHLALLGAFGFAVMGALFWLVPRITRKKLFSPTMMNATWWVAFTGFVIFLLSMLIGGLVQNAGWAVHMTIAQVLPQMDVWFLTRAIGGGMVVIGAYMVAVNLILTLLIGKPRLHPEDTEYTTKVPGHHIGYFAKLRSHRQQ